MEYVLTPYSKKMESFVWWEGAFTETELDTLQAKAQKADAPAQVGNATQKGELNENVRRSDLSWVKNDKEFSWVFEKLAQVVSKLNADYFGFDLVGFGEPIQLTNYGEDKRGMYGWHKDFGGQISRKLSMVLQLSDPADYEGGNLEIMTSENPQKMRKQRGLIIVFPSWTLHQVTPVVQGSRQSLVAWVSGPPFK